MRIIRAHPNDESSPPTLPSIVEIFFIGVMWLDQKRIGEEIVMITVLS